VAARTRAALIEAAARLLRTGRRLTMRGVAANAGVSRSTLYRHFEDLDALVAAMQAEMLARVQHAIAMQAGGVRPALAELRGVVEALIDVGRALPVVPPDGTPDRSGLAEAGAGLVPLAERLAKACELDRAPAAAWLAGGAAHLIEACLRAGWNVPDADPADVERLAGAIAGRLDRGLLLLDAAGRIVASNPGGCVAVDDPTAGRVAAIHDGGLYEDGSMAPASAHPVSTSLATGEPAQAIRGHRDGNGAVSWLSIEVIPLRPSSEASIYGFVAVFCDVTAEHRFQRGGLQPAGTLGGTDVPVLDIVRVLDEVPPPLLPEQLVAEAARVARGPVALYVVDIDGSHLLRLAGAEEFPARLAAPLALGPELAEDGLPRLTARIAEEMPGAAVAAMWLRGRAVGLLLARRGSEAGLRDVARLGAAAMELAGGYTDIFDDARRRKDMTPAAEIQQSLLPPRIVRMGSGELAGSVLPSYEVGGDWFDYVENRDGAWIAIADGAGRGPAAAGLSSVTLAALRAARRSHATLEEAAELMDETVHVAGGPEFFVTAILARWHPVYSLFSWINLGHPPPLLIAGDATAQELQTQPDLPLGFTDRGRTFRRHQRRLDAGDRVVLYTDGISRRRTAAGAFDVDGIITAVRTADSASAAATARAIQEAVVSASEDPLPDDAAVVVLAATGQA
jgi:AcrR family transcriptional regulator